MSNTIEQVTWSAIEAEGRCSGGWGAMSLLGVVGGHVGLYRPPTPRIPLAMLPVFGLLAALSRYGGTPHAPR